MPAADGYIGNTVCKTCHADVWFNFYKNPHYKSIASGDQPPERTGCEGCHGPGKAHVEARGGKTTIPNAFSLMDSRAVLDTCLNCHERDFSKANIRRSQHSLAEVVCTNCHSIHKSPAAQFLLAQKQTELCYGCHADVRAQFSMPFGAAIAVIDGVAGVDQFTIEKARAPKIRELMNKVVLVKDPRIEENFPKEWPARVTIEIENGQRHEKFVRYPKGDPENALTWDEMAAKFLTLAGAVLSPERCNEIIARISSAKPAELPALCS